MASAHKVSSSFVIDKNQLTKDDLWDIIFYTTSLENAGELWEIEVQSKYQWVSGHTRGVDTGRFYQFLVRKGLDKKIEIIRG